MAVLQADPAPPAKAVRRPRERWTPYALLAPTLVLVAVFLLYPIGSVVYYSLFKYNVTKPRSNGNPVGPVPPTTRTLSPMQCPSRPLSGRQ